MKPLLMILATGMALAQPQSPAQPQALPDGYVGRKEITARGLAPAMKVKDLGAAGHTYEVTFGKGDEVASGLTEFAEKNHITTGHFTGVGAFSSALLGWTDPDKRAFKKVEINEEAEVLSFVGSISTLNGKPYVHAHVVVGLPDGSTKGGHFLEGHVGIVMEVFVTDNSERDSTSAK
jgi:predicted DNA-binding protein with PD1-like motif